MFKLKLFFQKIIMFGLWEVRQSFFLPNDLKLHINITSCFQMIKVLDNLRNFLLKNKNKAVKNAVSLKIDIVIHFFI